MLQHTLGFAAGLSDLDCKELLKWLGLTGQTEVKASRVHGRPPAGREKPIPGLSKETEHFRYLICGLPQQKRGHFHRAQEGATAEVC